MGQLSVVLSGICAFTPGSPPLNGSTGNDFLVVLPEARTSRSSTQVPNTTIPAHQPFLAVPTSAINTSLTTRSADQTAGGFSIVFLDRELVDVSPSSSQSLSFNQAGLTAPQTRPSNGPQETDVFWIADMRQIWPAVDEIRSDCRPGTLPVSNNVVAQLRLSGGMVSSGLLPAQPISEFLPVKDDEVVKTLAGFTTVTMPFASSVTTAELELTSIDDGDATGVIVLNIPTSGTVEVRIGNMPTADINAWFGASHTPQHDTIDADFELYYQILPNPPDSQLPLPHPVAEGLTGNCRPLMTE